MTDWFVDSGATGGATGLTPADAVIDVFSFFAANSTVYGDRVWIAKNYLHDITGNPNLYKPTAVSANNAGKIQVIGWPNSGDPYYYSRPVEAISAGWDSHIQPASLGQGDMPTFSTSTYLSNGIDTDRNHDYFNMCFVDSAAGTYCQGCIEFAVLDESSWKDNIHFILNTQYNNDPLFNFGKVKFTIQNDGGNGYPQDIDAREVIVTSQSVFDSFLRMISDTAINICRLEMHTTSYNYLADRLGASNEKSTKFVSINYAQGNKPLLGPIKYSSTYEIYPCGIIIDEYFGDGPALITDAGELGIRQATAAELVYNSFPVGLMIGSGATTEDGYTFEDHYMIAAKAFLPTSGDDFTLEWPILTTVASLFNPNTRPPYMAVVKGRAAPNFLEISSHNVSAGSLDVWSGSLKLASSSAWIATGSFNAVGSQDLVIGLFLPAMLQGDGQAGVHSGYLAAPGDW